MTICALGGICGSENPTNPAPIYELCGSASSAINSR